MANIGIVSDFSTNILRRYFEPKLLRHAEDNLQLSKLSQKKTLPRGQGSDNTVRFFRRKPTTLSTAGVVNDSTTGNARVSNLTEASPLSTLTDTADYEKVDCTLAQHGALSRIGDLTSAQMLLPLLKDTVALFGEEMALYIDQRLSQLLTTGASTAMDIYAGGATNSATLDALSQSAGALTMVELLRAVTKIKANRGRLINGYAYAVVPVQAELDIMQDADWIDSRNYANPQDRIKGELGSFGAVKIVSTTNPFKEDLADAAEHTYDGSDTNANTGYITNVIGADAFGDVALSGMSPYSPKIFILDSADKADPLNQFTSIGWKIHWVGVVLNNLWYSQIRHKVTL
jgi:N4-gp56 family major capsid protein